MHTLHRRPARRHDRSRRPPVARCGRPDRDASECAASGSFRWSNRDGRLTGVITRRELSDARRPVHDRGAIPRPAPVIAWPDETLRTVAERMATSHLFVLPVVEPAYRQAPRADHTEDILQARAWAHQRETKLERLRMPFPARTIPKRLGADRVI